MQTSFIEVLQRFIKRVKILTITHSIKNYGMYKRLLNKIGSLLRQNANV
jgi:hypothetical protein